MQGVLLSSLSRRALFASVGMWSVVVVQGKPAYEGEEESEHSVVNSHPISSSLSTFPLKVSEAACVFLHSSSAHIADNFKSINLKLSPEERAEMRG